MARKNKVASTELVSVSVWEKQLKTDVGKQSAKIVLTGGNRISIKGGSFKFKGADLGDKLNVVVLDFIHERTYYDTLYDKENPSIPACYALSSDLASAVPAENAVKVQSKTCASCQHDQWGSSANKKSKSCGEHRLLALASIDDLKTSPVGEVEVVLLSVPVTSGKNFDKFALGVEKTMGRPTYGVICTITFDTKADYETLIFKADNKIDDMDIASRIMYTLKQAAALLVAGYDPKGYVKAKLKLNKSSRKKSKFSK